MLFLAQGISNNYDTKSSEFNDDGDDDDDQDDEQDTRSQLYKPVGSVRKRESPWNHLTKHHCALPRIQVKSPVPLVEYWTSNTNMVAKVSFECKSHMHWDLCLWTKFYSGTRLFEAFFTAHITLATVTQLLANRNLKR